MQVLELVIRSRDSEDVIAEEDYIQLPYIPRIGDTLWVLELDDYLWSGAEYTETATVEKVLCSVCNGKISVICKADQKHIDKSL